MLNRLFNIQPHSSAHIRELTLEGKNRATILMALSASSWRADKKILIGIYRALVLSKIKYECEFFDTACKITLADLDNIQNNFLRLILRAEFISPIISIEVESGIHPLKVQRMGLQIAYSQD